MARRIELVAHCWRYSRLWRYQLQSLWQHYWNSAGSDVTLTVYCAAEHQDRETWEALAGMHGRLLGGRLRLCEQPLAELFNRAIGRNRAALQTEADWVWFTDCDYLFGPQCLHQLAAHDPQQSAAQSPLWYPRTVWQCCTHAIGDAYIHCASPGSRPEIDTADFVPRPQRRAIGGIQIVPGSIAREQGYCPTGSKWLQPIATPIQFADMRSDRAYRVQLGTPGQPLDLADVYRLRHSKSFRDPGGADN